MITWSWLISSFLDVILHYLQDTIQLWHSLGPCSFWIPLPFPANREQIQDDILIESFPIFLKNLTKTVNGYSYIPLMTWLYQLSHYCHWQSWQIQMDLQCSPATNYKVCFNHQCKRIIKTIPKEGKYSNLWGNKCSLSLSFVFFSFPWLLLQLLLPFLCWFLFLTHEILTSFKLSIDLQIKEHNVWNENILKNEAPSTRTESTKYSRKRKLHSKSK